MNLETLGRLFIAFGIGIALLGFIFWLLARTPLTAGLGNLPGDLRIQIKGLTCFVPLASMVIASLLLTIALNILIRLMNR